MTTQTPRPKQQTNRKRICVFTGTRAEYGLLRPLLSELRASATLELQILVSGTHLSPEFGLTYRAIEEDGFVIDEKVEMLLSSDSAVGISKSMALCLMGCAEALNRLQPDLLIILGDRFEAFSVAAAALISCIPIAHLYGGEATYGAMDESIRHAITKMSHLHFTSTEVYRQRVIQLGEDPARVFHVGALGIENIRNLELLSKAKLAEVIGFSPALDFALVTFHPVTLEQASAEEQFTELLTALADFPELKIIFTKANADTDGRVINQLIDRTVRDQPERFLAFTSMGQRNYLSAMRFCRAIVGNSSSGIIEAPSFHVPTINIGNRQQGRLCATSVIDCPPQASSISQALKKGLSDDFHSTLKQTTNPYEKADTAKNIVSIIEKTNLADIIKKEFHDLHFPSST
ncbi:MAG: UDP-N-acetylglucosamine 2-epimerase (hydrolyzing) [Proteobacteria bacterium]|nr:UDP-N-acetylglucosamine 2-epimerase (hydrolyzing) [Pseudomonadota bacterium]MBU1641456.1 UDP-N-acetylglucosamine 2-epimerase (hydrolyzing) [Pseudomonadota bacterium]